MVREQSVVLGVRELKLLTGEKRKLEEHKRLAHRGKVSQRCRECQTRQARIRTSEGSIERLRA